MILDSNVAYNNIFLLVKKSNKYNHNMNFEHIARHSSRNTLHKNIEATPYENNKMEVICLAFYLKVQA